MCKIMILKELQYNGFPVAVELSKRDDVGRLFSSTYVTYTSTLTSTEIDAAFSNANK